MVVVMVVRLGEFSLCRLRSIQMRVLNGNYDDAAVDVKIGEEGRRAATERARC